LKLNENPSANDTAQSSPTTTGRTARLVWWVVFILESGSTRGHYDAGTYIVRVYFGCFNRLVSENAVPFATQQEFICPRLERQGKGSAGVLKS
jgi:hypothetical protein